MNTNADNTSLSGRLLKVIMQTTLLFNLVSNRVVHLRAPNQAFYRKKQQKTVKNENKEYIAVPVNTAASTSEQRDQV